MISATTRVGEIRRAKNGLMMTIIVYRNNDDIDIQFEDQSLKGIEDYDGYLTHCYGSYMELPPKEKRKVHPVSSIRLL